MFFFFNTFVLILKRVQNDHVQGGVCKMANCCCCVEKKGVCACAVCMLSLIASSLSPF